MTLVRLATLSGLIFFIGAQTACISTSKKKKKANITKTEPRNPFSSDEIYFYEKEDKTDTAIVPTTRRAERPELNLWKGYSEDQLSAGAFNMESIKKVTSENSHEIAACYQEANSYEPQTGPTDLLISFSINSYGKVVRVETISSPFKDAVVSKLNSCLIEKMVTWRFPSPEQDFMTIEQPFTFGI